MKYSPEFIAEVASYKQQFLRAERQEQTWLALHNVAKLTALGALLGFVAAIGWVLA